MPLLVLIVLALASSSCWTARAAQASTCREQGRAIITTAASCPEAVAALERLVQRSPECAAILNDDAGAGVHCKDGGAHDGP